MRDRAGYPARVHDVEQRGFTAPPLLYQSPCTEGKPRSRRGLLRTLLAGGSDENQKQYATDIADEDRSEFEKRRRFTNQIYSCRVDVGLTFLANLPQALKPQAQYLLPLPTTQHCGPRIYQCI